MNEDKAPVEHEIVLPRLHGNSSYYKVLAWLKEIGDAIRPGDSLLILETDKATIELESEVSGVLVRISQAAGEWVEVLTVVGTIECNSQSNEGYE